MNKNSETKNSNDNSSGAANTVNNKTKDYNQKKRTTRVVTTLALITIFQRTAPAEDRMVTSQLNAFKNLRGRATKVIQKIELVVKNVRLMT